ncbi:MAG: NAD(+)/NADH kinase [Candidatus Bathyarchaeota archaeon]|nr:NAD(+)/NADH kinase [Candidatus Bathyarchaeota archaeon]
MCEKLSKAVGIIARTDRKDALSLVTQLTDRFEKEGFKVLLEPNLANSINRTDNSTPPEKMNADLIVTVGGDGTILRTCLRIPKPEPPILAIDMGVRGFLTEVPPERAIQAVEKYLKGSYFIERYSKLATFIGEARLPDALNEVFITSRYLAKLLHVRIWRDNLAVADCRADGVIVASQAGSTGYAFSAGGPILDPGLDAFVLTPVCPITFMRPIVFSSDSQVTVELLKPRVATVVIDGDFQGEMDEKNPSILIKKSEHESSFIRFEGNFYQRLKARLLFSREEGYENG